MKTLQKLPIALILLIAVTGCKSLYTSTVTITKVVDAAMKDWAALSVAGKTTPAVDAKVIAAHNTYRDAASALEKALVAYKANGDQAPYLAALTALRSAADALITLITPLLTPGQGTTLKNNLVKAVSP